MDYLEINRKLWNARTPIHVESKFYDIQGFLAGNTSLKPIELNILPDLSGLSILHLQCHFGQDTISLDRLGARRVVGVDLSDLAIKKARELALQAGSQAEFVLGDVYDAPNLLDEKFDIVFASYGTIGWLPDINKWAEVVAHFLEPGGKLVFAEFHPFIWMFDNNLKEIVYSYSQTDPIVDLEENTYTDADKPINLESVTWNHSLSEVISSLMLSGMSLKHFEEYDYSPFDCFSNTCEIAHGKFQISHLLGKIPMVYSLIAEKC